MPMFASCVKKSKGEMETKIEERQAIEGTSQVCVDCKQKDEFAA